jgi:hypothetical protein
MTTRSKWIEQHAAVADKPASDSPRDVLLTSLQFEECCFTIRLVSLLDFSKPELEVSGVEENFNDRSSGPTKYSCHE